ncbi:PREDICTED: nuclear RNA export factor 1-like [Polistes canadensis]|uniref:nuclear RNA export factor 1-like n=1 Tax=Polistes canadensis TaxID=91411 RepID=UPI000718F558|nr:PREDICTED: nuclear RNA export factor 1-like [Polistes canadensis]
MSDKSNKSNKTNKSNKSIRRKRGRRKRNSEDKNFGNNDVIGGTNNNIFGNRRRITFKSPEGLNIPNLSLVLDDNILNSNNINFRFINPKIKEEIKKSFLHAIEDHVNHKLQIVKPRRTKWFKIMISCDGYYSQDYILDNLRKVIKGTFEPLMFKISGKKASFYVDNYIAANNFASCEREICHKIGLLIDVNSGCPPQCDINDDLKERLKKAIGKRYVQKTNALDLSKFYSDSDLITDYFCPLSRPAIIEIVLDIVHEYLPTLEALNLDDNMLNTTYKLWDLHTQLPKLKILHLGDNKIVHINQLFPIKELQLEELRLAGNPLSDKYTSQNDYIRDVRKRFPKLIRLDDIELSLPMLFDIDDGMKVVPPTQQLFVRDAKAQDIANQFFMEYFSIFDSENKHPLLNAYDEHACFSLTVTKTGKLHVYLAEDRNLLRLSNYNKRVKLLKQGRLQILSCITQLPQTKHHLSTFTMDISIVTEQMMLIELTGLFTIKLNDQLCYFSRTFIIVPKKNGYCISNEQLHISLPTKEQRKKFFANNCSIQQIANGFKKMEL